MFHFNDMVYFIVLIMSVSFPWYKMFHFPDMLYFIILIMSISFPWHKMFHFPDMLYFIVLIMSISFPWYKMFHFAAQYALFHYPNNVCFISLIYVLLLWYVPISFLATYCFIGIKCLLHLCLRFAMFYYAPLRRRGGILFC